ncbi:hypothetical protein HDU91_001967, partial [Kappamyces sp. JEL0680]
TVVQYKIDEFGKASRTGVEDVGTIDPTTCTPFQSYCLNEASQPYLSYTLFNATLGGGPIVVRQQYTYNFGLIPDPSWPFSDLVYQSFVTRAFPSFLLGAAATYLSSATSETTLETDSIYFQSSDAVWIQWVVVIVSVLAFFQTVAVLVLDFFLLRNSSNKLLRRLYRAVTNPNQRMSDFCDFALSEMESKDHYEDLGKATIRFGELKKTRDDIVGQLGFGVKKDIVKFKNMREYRNG